ncbi:Imm10 family immunity protein [Telluria beijingensis]|uniref:Imm10 family immunity protein n=1 Tax=Telluria beijingensis TaxID=3068633 RepID=UPI0027961D6E|nr:Imm10 family immunity protein [Massilia sp. REN29]
MNEVLVATLVSFEEDAALVTLAFAADEGQSAQYLMLQYSLQTDEQDRRLHLDGLYIERNDQAFGCYRGVASIRRIGDRIDIVLNAEGKRRLKAETIAVSPVNWSPAIDQGLARLAELSRGEYDVEA